MLAENRAHTPRRASSSDFGPATLNPRVVILHRERQHLIEVLELPESTTIGACFRHRGTTWRVTGQRTSSRVLIAEPER